MRIIQTLFLVLKNVSLTNSPTVVAKNWKQKTLTNCVLFSCELIQNPRCTTMRSGYTASVRVVKCERLQAVFIGKKRMF